LSEETGVGGEESVSGELGERVRALVAAAEGMAAAVRSDADSYAERRRQEADAEAERRLSEASEQAEALLSERLARISELSDGILELAEEVSRALTEAAERLRPEVAGGGSRVAEPEPEPEDEHPMADQVRPLRPPGERPPRPLRTVVPAHVPRNEGEMRLDDARLVALQMAVAGRTRDEVGAHLKTAFDVPDPDPILDHVFADGFPPRPHTGA
jgi:hypothetical protein